MESIPFAGVTRVGLLCLRGLWGWSGEFGGADGVRQQASHQSNQPLPLCLPAVVSINCLALTYRLTDLPRMAEYVLELSRQILCIAKFKEHHRAFVEVGGNPRRPRSDHRLS